MEARDEGGSRAETDVVVVVSGGGRHSHGSTNARADRMQWSREGSKGWRGQWLHRRTTRRKRGLCSRADAETAAAEASGEGGDGPGESKRAAAEAVGR